MFKDYAYSVIPNKRYSYGAVYIVYGIWESARELGINYGDVELSDWLMFQHYEREVDGNVVRVFGDGSALATVYSFDGSKDRVLIRAKPNKGQYELLKKIIESREKYMPRVVVRDYGVRGGELYVSGEVHVSISYDFYLRYAKRYGEPRGSLVSGVDVNTDRINLAIIDEDGMLRDRKTFWFSEATARGYPRSVAWSIIGMKIHEMLKYAYHHGVSTLAVENPEILGRLKLFWVRSGERKSENYNWRVAVFRSRIAEMIALKAPLYSIEVKYVDPKGTTNSEEHDEVMKRYGLDRHTASAYIIARRLLTTSN
ncbi:MAG: hypothetical protein B7O98_05490 [Zestosphaera tikiterensis]|uniref:Uncharacterized protein n=1 Tax=Zestosphaera tikiterensis TaxID=1973259 RepID=A0A2R7Y5B6_9CREN|nr:MAG: hypothetical protein B7O98_05490 [Zestosphaera tikiterensis]